MSARKRFYVIQNEEQSGPLNWEQLKQLSFGGRGTRVWTEGFTDWVMITGAQDLLVKMGEAAGVPPAVHIAPPSPYATTPGQPLVEPAGRYYDNSYIPLYKAAPDSVIYHDDPVLAAGYQYADWGLRFAAGIIDFIIISVIDAFLIKYTTWAFPLLYMAMGAIGALVMSGTPGNAAVQIKVIDASTAEDMKNPFKGALRELAKVFSMCFILPLIWLFWDKRKQNIYDKVFNTVVVRKTKIAI